MRQVPQLENAWTENFELKNLTNMYGFPSPTLLYIILGHSFY